MRLIDEKQLVITGDCKEIDGELYIKVSDVERCLDNAPIAYNPDKIVEQLENASCYIEDGDGHAGHLVFTDEAIEIVKGGAV